MNELVVVTGATGNVGGKLIAQLLAQGRSVRAAVPDAASAELLDSVDAVRFDFDDATTWAAAFDGATAVFLVRPPAIADVKRRMGGAIAAAAATGAHIVTLSVLGAGSNPLVPHHKMEKLVTRSGAPFTHLRPGFFMQNLSTTYRTAIRDHGEIFVPAGRGRTSFIDIRDIAEAAARVLGKAQHFGRSYTLTGGEALTYHDVARVLSRVLGRTVRYAAPTPRAFRTQLLAEGLPADYVRVLASIYFVARWHLAGRITRDTAALLGRAPISFERFAHDHAHLWQHTSSSTNQRPPVAAPAGGHS